MYSSKPIVLDNPIYIGQYSGVIVGLHRQEILSHARFGSYIYV